MKQSWGRRQSNCFKSIRKVSNNDGFVSNFCFSLFPNQSPLSPFLSFFFSPQTSKLGSKRSTMVRVRNKASDSLSRSIFITNSREPPVNISSPVPRVGKSLSLSLFRRLTIVSAAQTGPYARAKARQPDNRISI